MSTVSFRMRVAKNSAGAMKHYEVYGQCKDDVSNFVPPVVCSMSASSKGLAADFLKRDNGFLLTKQALEKQGYKVSVLF